ncbi:MAG TPA: conjugal transfer protein TraG, partial [Desulfosporosinus sp.]|nr:conjugal transfer protein TraG [Desulfosporosinus sp.]
VAGGRGMRFTLAIQDIAQLKKLYDSNAQTITGNCHNWIYLKTADIETAKLISEKTGKYTVETENSSSSVQPKSHSISHGVGFCLLYTSP